MKKGGYQIIDLSAYKFTNGESQSIPNVYNIIKNTKKVVLISGLTVDDTEYHDMFTVFIPYETHFYGLAQYEGNNIYFSVTKDGSVGVNVAEATKEPVAYLYNGIKLPVLPVWDSQIYKYAFITDSSIYATHTARLYIFSDYEYRDADANNRYIEFTPSYEYSIIYYDVFEEGDWSQKTDIEQKSVLIGNIDWANFDVIKSDGSVKLMASEPIPVYE